MQFKPLAVLTAASLLFLTAAPGFAAGTHPETGEPLAEDQTFAYRMLDEFKTLDPQLNEETAGFHVIRDLFEGLMNSSPSGEVEPGVALSYETNDDNTMFTFTLREDAKWSNGDPVTAGDFVYAWRRAVDPALASPYAWYVELATLKNATQIIAGEMPPEELGVRAVDDYTLEVVLEKPTPYFAEMTTYATFFPAHQATIEAHGDNWTKPGNIVSNGAYVLTELVPGEYHTREKSPTYWNADSVIIEKTTGMIINDENQALTRYLAGEVNHVEPLPAGKFPELLDQYPDQAVSVPRLCSYYYAFNHSDSGPEALKDVRVRRAMSLAVDRSVIVDQILKGGQTAAYNFAHAKTAGFEMPTIDYAQMSQAERDAEAKRLMEEAGYGDGGLSFKLIYNTSESHKQIATVVSQMWKQKLGIETSLSNFEWKTYLDIRSQQQFDLARGAWCADYNEPSTFLDLMSSNNDNNDGKFVNAELDQLLEDARFMSDPTPNYTRIEEILAEEMAIIPIYHYANAFMLNADIKGWPYDNADNNWYSRQLYRVAAE